MNRILTIIITLLFIYGCTSNTIYKKPEDLIPQDQMIDLMVDIYMANAALNMPNTADVRNIQYLPLVYYKYHIDSTRFKSSNFYYMTKIKDYKIISQSVVDKLSALKKIHEIALKRTDSLLIIKADSIKEAQEAEFNLTDSVINLRLDSINKNNKIKNKNALKKTVKRKLSPTDSL